VSNGDLFPMGGIQPQAGVFPYDAADPVYGRFQPTLQDAGSPTSSFETPGGYAAGFGPGQSSTFGSTPWPGTAPSTDFTSNPLYDPAASPFSGSGGSSGGSGSGGSGSGGTSNYLGGLLTLGPSKPNCNVWNMQFSGCFPQALTGNQSPGQVTGGAQAACSFTNIPGCFPSIGDFASRATVVVLGFIFVAAGLFMFGRTVPFVRHVVPSALKP
jgi:hypothetical protein